MRPRLLILPLTAALIVALVAYKESRTYTRASGDEAGSATLRPAPRFELFDDTTTPVRFERYLGRWPVILAFFDGDVGADGDPTLSNLREQFQQLERAGIEVVAVSKATPYANRQAVAGKERFPFPLLSDPDFQIHGQWGLYDSTTREARTGIFLIDRAGRVPYLDGYPQPKPSVDAVLQEVLGRE